MFVIATAGHIDHGKTTLVKRLTGIDTDRLPIEKETGMSIDLGFAHYQSKDGKLISIIDVPGHEKFIQNMIAGMHDIDLAILVVSAGEGIKHQTIEHLDIIHMLGIKKIIIAITKCDIYNDHKIISNLEKELKANLDSWTEYKKSNSIQYIKINDDESIKHLSSMIDKQLINTKPKHVQSKPRMSIDRIFTLKGFGTVVTGTSTNGSFHVGDEIAIMPQNITSKIRGLHASGQIIKISENGSRLAINLQGIKKESLDRGNVVRLINDLTSTTRFDASLMNISDKIISHNKKVNLYIGTANCEARIKMFDNGLLKNNTKGFCQIHLSNSLSINQFDKFVIRFSGKTIGGGEVLRVNSSKYNSNNNHEVHKLIEIENRNFKAIILDRIQQAEPTTVKKIYLDLEEEKIIIDKAIKDLYLNKIIQIFTDDKKEIIYSATKIYFFEKKIINIINSFLKQNAIKKAMPFKDLAKKIKINDYVLQKILSSMKEINILNSLEVTLASYQNRLTNNQLKILNEAEMTIEKYELNPRNIQFNKETISLLKESERIKQIGPGVFLTNFNYIKACEIISHKIKENGTITLAESRDILKINRKLTQLILETMDKDRITVRKENVRILLN
ncbi:MAG: selenocysteine-specific translation elongation factor [Dehalococcoidia bacterium]